MENVNTGSIAIASEKKNLWTREFIFIALINLTTFIGFNMTTTGMPIYVAQLGGTDMMAGLVISLATGSALFIRPFTGIVLDRFGRKSILVISIGAMAAVIIAYAVFPVLGIILGLRVVHGIGWGLGSTATSTIAADIIPRGRFAEGMGYFALATSLATAVAPALSVALLQNAGVRPMIGIAAGCTIISLFCALFQPSQGAKKTHMPQKLRLSDLFDRKALLPAGMMFLFNCAFAAVTTFIALHSQARGVDNIFLYFTVFAAVMIISRPVIGKIIDQKGFFIPGVLSAVGLVATLMLIAGARDIGMFCVAGVFGGLGMGTGMGVLQTMAVASAPNERRGVATATFLFGLDAGIAVGAAISGAIASMVGYGNMYLILSVFPATAAVIFILLGKERIARYSAKQ